MKKVYKNAICLLTVKEIASGSCATGTAVEKTVLIREVPANQDAVDCATPADGSDIDLDTLTGKSTKIVSFTITNNEVTDQNVLFGTWAGQEGNNTFFDLPASAVDANVADEFGNHLQKVSGFNLLVCTRPILVSKIEVFTDDVSQRAKRFTKVTLDIDANLCDTKGRVPVSDTQVTAVIMNGLYAITDRNGLQYPVRPFATVGSVEIQFTILAEASIQKFPNATTN